MPSKEDIILWLEKIEKNRKWLAEKCLVTPGQCYNWFSVNGKIPTAKLELIKKLINETEKQPGQNEITLEFSDAEMEIVNQFKTKYPSIDIREYARGKVFELCSSMVSPGKTSPESAGGHHSTLGSDEPHHIQNAG